MELTGNFSGSIPRPLVGILDSLDIQLQQFPYPKPSNVKIPGTYCKNLVVQDKKKQKYLLIVHENQTLDLNKVRKDINASCYFSFVKGEELYGLMQVHPGHVTPLALYAKNGELNMPVYIEKKLLECDWLHFHPMDPSSSVLLTPNQLLRFLELFSSSSPFSFYDFGPLNEKEDQLEMSEKKKEIDTRVLKPKTSKKVLNEESSVYDLTSSCSFCVSLKNRTKRSEENVVKCCRKRSFMIGRIRCRCGNPFCSTHPGDPIK